MSSARILIIAGSDSGGGAGIQADIKTVTLLGGHAMTAITAITAQNTLGVDAVHPIPAEMVIAQIDAVASDIGIDAIKIGMIGSATIAATVADRLDRPDLADLPLVFDPVMIATSGSRLASQEAITVFARLLRRATVSTPNLDELEVLCGAAPVPIRSRSQHKPLPSRRGGTIADMAGQLIAATGGGAILATGIRLPLDRLGDMLVTTAARPVLWEGDRIDTIHDHGTGCTLASAIATGLGQGMGLPDAILRARAFVRAALVAAPGLGGGHGPMGYHFPPGQADGSACD